MQNPGCAVTLPAQPMLLHARRADAVVAVAWLVAALLAASAVAAMVEAAVDARRGRAKVSASGEGGALFRDVDEVWTADSLSSAPVTLRGLPYIS